jgi:hypothetical protein
MHASDAAALQDDPCYGPAAELAAPHSPLLLQQQQPPLQVKAGPLLRVKLPQQQLLLPPASATALAPLALQLLLL